MTPQDMARLCLLYAVERYRRGDFSNITEMGLSLRDAATLANMADGQLAALCEIRTDIVQITFNQILIHRLHERVVAKEAEEQQQLALIRYGAPRALMELLFGMPTKEYARLRKQMQISGTGRPRALSEDDKEKIWHFWRATEGAAELERWLEVGEKCHAQGVGLNSAWSVIQQFQYEYGLLRHNALCA